MTDTEALAEANRIVEMFKPFAEAINVIDGIAGTDNNIWEENAKQCAIILCDEMMKNVNHLRSNFLGGGWFTGNIEHWQKIKSLIEKMYDERENSHSWNIRMD